ncbi:hypothetical protein Tco_0169460 [Tanacetum coccineum]
MEQYLALTRWNKALGVVKPEIRNNINFEIKSQLMKELREKNKTDDAYEHVEKVLDIVSLFNILRVSHDAIMLRVFPITLTGATKRLIDRIPSGTINTWDLLKKDFIQRRISSGNSDGIDTITSKLDSLGRDMKKLKENVLVIQVGCVLCGGTHLDEEYPLNEEVNEVEEVKYDEETQEVEEVEETKEVTTSNDMPIITYYVAPYESLIPFPGRLTHHAEEALVSRLMKSLREIKKCLADLQASISIMPLSMDKQLGLGIPNLVNMTMEMADRNMVKDFRMPIILGRPLLATAHAEIDVFIKLISLEVGNEKVVFKIEDNINEMLTPIESVCTIRNIECIREDVLLKINHHLFLYNSASCVKTNEFNNLLSIDADIFSNLLSIEGRDFNTL